MCVIACTAWSDANVAYTHTRSLSCEQQSIMLHVQAPASQGMHVHSFLHLGRSAQRSVSAPVTAVRAVMQHASKSQPRQVLLTWAARFKTLRRFYSHTDNVTALCNRRRTQTCTTQIAWHTSQHVKTAHYIPRTRSAHPARSTMTGHSAGCKTSTSEKCLPYLLCTEPLSCDSTLTSGTYRIGTGFQGLQRYQVE